MGASLYAYPCATETRWMHQLLVRYFSNMTMRLLEKHQPELGITERWIQAVNIAALCHDIGHCTFSHLFDQELLSTFTNVPEVMRDHETRGTLLLEWMNRHYKFGLDAAQVRLIQYLITCNSEAGILEGYPGWLFDIVNARNMLDTDKISYLHSNALASHGHVRDLQIERILDQQRVLTDKICHPRKLHRLINDVLHHRMLAFLELYRHKLMPKVESIVICIFKHMAKALEWDKLLMNPEADGHRWCIEMTDAAIDCLPNLLNPTIFNRLSDMQQEELTKAYELYVRLETRDWFETVEKLALIECDDGHAAGDHATSPSSQEAASLSNLTELTKPTMTFSYVSGYSNNEHDNPIDKILLFSPQSDGYRIETLRAVLQAEKGNNPHYEKYRTVIVNEDG
jgi:HD superfamily phosphohydrolase